MNASLFLQWNYLVFLLPLGVALLLLALSSLRVGGHRAGHHHRLVGNHRLGGHSHAGARHADGRHHAPSPTRAAHKSGGKSEPGEENDTTPPLGVPALFLLNLIGIGRAPLPIILQMLALFWGVAGILANQLFLPDVVNPAFAQMGTPLAIAFWSSLIGTRLGAEIIGRLLPEEESFDVSGDALYGLTGKVVFPVTETSGRLHVYDDHQTLHDERCCTAPGQPPLAKGDSALIVDRAPNGSLLVERI